MCPGTIGPGGRAPCWGFRFPRRGAVARLSAANAQLRRRAVGPRGGRTIDRPRAETCFPAATSIAPRPVARLQQRGYEDALVGRGHRRRAWPACRELHDARRPRGETLICAGGPAELRLRPCCPASAVAADLVIAFDHAAFGHNELSHARGRRLPERRSTPSPGPPLVQQRARGSYGSMCEATPD
jgi:hypothetical protein